MPRCAHGHGHALMRSNAHTLAAVGGWTAREQSAGAGATGGFPKRRDQVGSPGLKGGARWSWSFGFYWRAQGPWRGREGEGFTFSGGEWEAVVAWSKRYGEAGGDDDKGEEIERIDRVEYEVRDG